MITAGSGKAENFVFRRGDGALCLEKEAHVCLLNYEPITTHRKRQRYGEQCV